MKRGILCSLMVVLIFAAGCMHWQSLPIRQPEENISAEKIRSVLDKADTCCRQATERADLRNCLDQYKALVQQAPGCYQALISLAHLYLLWGDVYAEDRAGQTEAFQKALGYCEQAMYTNPSFAARIRAGSKPWQAREHLTVEEIDAIVFWVTGIFYYYKESLGPVGQVVNYPWLQRARIMLEYAESLDPDWGDGIIYLSWGFYYLSLPPAVGGDREKSAEYFQKAVETGPRQLIHRWGRGKYFHVKMQNKEGFVKDIQWVLAQDLDSAPGHSTWNRFYQRDAGNLLNRTAVLFP